MKWETAGEVTNGARPRTLRRSPRMSQVTPRLPCGTAGVIPVVGLQLVAGSDPSVFPAASSTPPIASIGPGLVPENSAKPSATRSQPASRWHPYSQVRNAGRRSARSVITRYPAWTSGPKIAKRLNKGKQLPRRRDIYHIMGLAARGGNASPLTTASPSRGTAGRGGMRSSPCELSGDFIAT
jgi:hypothetical protein